MLTNVQIEEALQKGSINIEPFNPDRLGLNCYVLTPQKVVISKFDGEGVLIEKTLQLSEKNYALAPREQITIGVAEGVVLSDRFFADLIPCSVCIEAGLHITCGQIEPNYTKEVRFGLCNMRDYEYVLKPGAEIVKVRFYKIADDAFVRPVRSKQRVDYEAIIERLRGERNEADKEREKADQRIKEIDKQIRELSIL
jgi:deoxycytidine triphosphate deaminase